MARAGGMQTGRRMARAGGMQTGWEEASS